MHVDEADTAVLKKWVVRRLEDISDADSDVLADYVLALVKSEDPDDKVKINCLENLEDFLRDHTAPFVDDVFNAIRTKSYLPGHTAPSQTVLSPTAPVFNPPSGPSFNPPSGPTGTTYRQPGAPGFPNAPYNGSNEQSRKRTYNEREGSENREARDPHYTHGAAGQRSIKQMRRGGGRPNALGPDGRKDGRQGHNSGRDANISALPGLGQIPMGTMGAILPMPTPPPGFPPLDPNNPLSAIMAMQAMGFPPLPAFPSLPAAASPSAISAGVGLGTPSRENAPSQNAGERCKDYDTKGFCALGSSCPYQHGPDMIVVPGQAEEYDPKNAMMDIKHPTNGHSAASPRRGSERGRGRGRMNAVPGNSHSARGTRASFSQIGPNHDRSVTTIVVEQIPEEKFDEQSVRDFFSQYGNISEINMQPYKRLALVKYEEWSSARRAYESPKVIFDNRFVKVYWYKPDKADKPSFNGTGKAGSPSAAKSMDEEMIDQAEIERKQAEAQKAHEEKAKKLKEAETKREELEKKLKAQAEERKLLLEKLAAKTAVKAASTSLAASPTSATANGPANDKKMSQTEALKAKLAELEAEAESMGLNPDEPFTGYGRGRGRGTYRGRGGFAPRGRGFDPYRGSPRGRGSFFGVVGGARGGAVKRLDNRPKKIAVSGVEFGTAKDEALRQYLFNNFEFQSIDPHPDRKDSQIVTFKERYVAENFIAQSTDIPAVGRVELSWVTVPATPTNAQPSQHTPSNDGEVVMGNGTGGSADSSRQVAEVDYDVADDDDRWMAVG